MIPDVYSTVLRQMLYNPKTESLKPVDKISPIIMVPTPLTSKW